MQPEIERRSAEPPNQRTPEGYLPMDCGLCGARGYGRLGLDDPCSTCKGTGKVLVLQPPLKCPRCGGSGRPKQLTDSLSFDPRRCVVCRGAGWARALVD